MPSSQSRLPVPVIYLLVLVLQGPLWMGGGVVWAVFMMSFSGATPISAIIGGIGWGLSMWILMGNMFALGLAWRRSVTYPAPNRDSFKASVERAASKTKLIVLADSPDEMTLGPKRALIRFSLQETRIQFEDGAAIVTGPALNFWAVKRALDKELRG